MPMRAALVLLAALVGLLPGRAFALVPVPTQLVSATQIASLAERVARSLVPDEQRALVPAYPLADQRVPVGTVAVASGAAQVNPSYVSIPIEIDVDGKRARTIFAGFRITTYVRVPVATRDLAAGTVLGAGDLRYERQPFTGRSPFDMEAVIGRKVRATLAAGATVFPELTAVAEIVHAGMPALLIVNDGPVRLAADVVARSSGGLGDYVSVYNPQTQRALSGIVTGPNTVELTLPGAERP